MAGKKLIGIFLIAGVMLAGSARAEGNPDQGLGSHDSGQVSEQNEMTIQSEVPLSGPTDGAAIDKGVTPEAEAVPEAGATPKAEAAPEEAEAEEAVEEASIADPIEPWNRAMFQFNDKLYFWALKPVARGYNAVVPEPARISVRSFFRNVAMPVRFVNSLFQGKFKAAGSELARFGINTTIGLVGFFDVAKSRFDLDAQNEDLGQTLGYYGMGGMMYIVWPFIGPSNVRDTIGFAGDTFLDPVSYIDPFEAAFGVNAYGQINKTSLELGTYEDMVESALEPYIAVRDAYIQYRNGLIKK
ncbi:MAG TPA: VacJ family lipoprotein [Geobacteraceae bacterium]|nr:VacJ family lipoprotein [Geobacteraceae bacterium]